VHVVNRGGGRARAAATTARLDLGDDGRNQQQSNQSKHSVSTAGGQTEWKTTRKTKFAIFFIIFSSVAHASCARTCALDDAKTSFPRCHSALLAHAVLNCAAARPKRTHNKEKKIVFFFHLGKQNCQGASENNKRTMPNAQKREEQMREGIILCFFGILVPLQTSGVKLLALNRLEDTRGH
jgi:hypothetical protein